MESFVFCISPVTGNPAVREIGTMCYYEGGPQGYTVVGGKRRKYPNTAAMSKDQKALWVSQAKQALNAATK